MEHVIREPTPVNKYHGRIFGQYDESQGSGAIPCHRNPCYSSLYRGDSKEEPDQDEHIMSVNRMKKFNSLSPIKNKK